MKKLLVIAIAVMMCVSFAACSGSVTSKSNTPYADDLKKQAESGEYSLYENAWLLYNWLTKNLESFKNPYSVELTGNAYYCEDEESGDIKFFLVEIRAQNSFGGNTVGYCKVTSNAIVQTDWQKTTPPKDFDGEKVWYFGTHWIENAFYEYMTNNYG